MHSPQSGSHDHVTSEIWLVCQTEGLLLLLFFSSVMDIGLRILSIAMKSKLRDAMSLFQFQVQMEIQAGRYIFSF